MPSLSILTLFCCLLYKIHPTSADYTCICNNGDAQKTIFKSQTGDSNVIGYMNAGICKAKHTVTNGLWLSVLYQHQVGYIQNDSNIHILKCVGDPRQEDALTTPVSRTTAEPIISTVGGSEITVTTNLLSTSDYKETNTDNKTTTSGAVDMTRTRPYTGKVSTDVISSVTEETTRPVSPTSAVLTSTDYIELNETNFITTIETMERNTTGTPYTTFTSVLQALTTSAPPTTAEPIISTVGGSEMTVTKILLSTSDYKETNTDNKTTTSEAVEETTRPVSPTSTSSVLTSTNYIESNETYSITTVKTMETNTTGKPFTTSTSVLQGHIEMCSSRLRSLAQNSTERIAQFGQNCYEIVQTHVSWFHAESNCKRHGGHLIHIASQQEQDYIYSILVKYHSSTVWIGLQDRIHEESFEWTSGNTVTYTNWKPGRKDYRYHNSEDCVFMTRSHGQWDDIECGGDNAMSELLQGVRHAYICQYATVLPPTTVDLLNNNGNTNMCPYRLRQQTMRDKGILGQYDHSCYEIIPKAKVAWQHAEEICHSRGGNLAYIRNIQEQAFLQGFLNRYSGDHAVWIGLTDHNSEGRFHWTSGAPVQFTNWVPGHLSNYASSSEEDCVAFIPYKNGQWDDIPCGSTHHSFFGGTSSSGETHPLLCQYPISSGPSLIG